MHHYKLFVMTFVKSSHPPQHTHTMTPEGNTLLYLLLKSLLPPTLEVHTRSPPVSMNTAEAKGREVYVDLKLHCPKHKMPNAYHKSTYLPRKLDFRFDSKQINNILIIFRVHYILCS